MKRRVIFSPQARAELDRASERYEHIRRGLGRHFRLAVMSAARRAVAAPQAAPLFPGVPAHLQVRRRMISRRFPLYVLAYRDLGSILRIDGVLHTRRLPGYWVPRLR